MKKTLKTFMVISAVALSFFTVSLDTFANETGSSFKNGYEEGLFNDEVLSLMSNNDINGIISLIDTYHKNGYFTKEQRDWRVLDARYKLKLYNEQKDDPIIFRPGMPPDGEEDNILYRVKEPNNYVLFLNSKQTKAFEIVTSRLNTIVSTKLKPSFEKMTVEQKNAQISSIEKKIQKMLQKEKSVLNQAILEQVRIELVFLK